MPRVPTHPAIIQSYTRPPEWRMNPVTGEWVIVAPERSSRPMMPEVHEEPTPNDEWCPFCAGRESRTPPELLAYRDANSQPNGPGWQVRCVPNSFPAVKAMSTTDHTSDSFYCSAPGVGQHELFVECPHHEANLARLPVEQIRLVTQIWRERMLAARNHPEIRYAQLFKNHGGDAGASVEHAHSQMVATPMVPPKVRAEMSFAAKCYEERGVCPYCELVEREKVESVRQVAESDSMMAFTAYAGRQPFETWILPKSHGSQFELMSPADADDLGTMLWTVLRKLDLALKGPSYNLVFHTAPFHEPPLPHYHWHVEVLPRLTQLAGYEWGAGSHINPIRPEDAALVLRETGI